MKRTTFFISLILIFLTIGLQTILAQVVFEHSDSVSSVAFSPVDDTLLASAESLDNTVRLWNVETHTNIAKLEGHVEAVTSIAFSPKGMLLASGAGDGTVKLWDVNTHTNIATFEEHAVAITSVTFSPDGRHLAAGALDGTIELWDVEARQNTATFVGRDVSILVSIFEEEYERFWPTPVSFSPDGSTLAAGTGNSIKLWDVETEENILTFEVPGEPVVSVSFSPDGTTLAAGLLSGIKLWDVATRTNTVTFPLPRGTFFIPIPDISFSHDGTLIAFTVSEALGLWDVETSTLINIFFEHTRAINSVSFSRDGSLASGSSDGTVRLWDVSSLKEPQEALGASTVFPLTESDLHGSVVTLTLNGHQFTDNEEHIADGVVVLVSGIRGVTVRNSFFLANRINDSEVAVELEFDGTDFDTDATLTFTLVAIEYVNYQGFLQVFTAQVPVTAIQQSNATVRIVPSPVVSPTVAERLTFSLNIAGGENVVGYQATVMFDDSVFEYTESANGDYLPTGAFSADPVINYNWIDGTLFDEGHWEGSVTLAANTLAGVANGDGTLATLTFEVEDFKASKLTLSQFYLVDSEGKLWEATIENAEITLPPEPADAILGDINRDGLVNIQDLVIVGARLGQRGHNSADLNGDGLVDIVDLVLVANELGAAAAAPSLNPQVLAQLTAADVKDWLKQARKIDLTDPAYLRGITVLEQLHKVLTPKVTALLPNFPNPFNPETWIPYHLSKDADVTLHIYTMNGTLVRTLTLGYQTAGMYQNRSRAAYWDGKNEFGEKVASGVYFYTLTAGEFSATRKMLIWK